MGLLTLYFLLLNFPIMKPDRHIKAISTRISAWLQLMRFPNLLTVPGDPIAGYLIAVQASYVSATGLFGVVLAALLFYAAGLIMNDLFDEEEDRRDRPDRPLPSGAVTVTPAVTLCSLMILFGAVICYALGMATTWIGFALVASMIAYNRFSKKFATLGPLNMGLCRGFSFLLGVAAAQVPGYPVRPVVLAFGFILLYVAAVTRIARTETRPDPGRLSFCLPFMAVIVGGFSFISIVIQDRDQAIALFLMFTWLVLLTGMTAWRLMRSPSESMFAHVGELIGGLILIQAILVIGSGATILSWLFCATLIALWPVNRLLARWFYAS